MIRYKAGYKYQLAEPYTIRLDVFPDVQIDNDYITLDRQGLLTMHKGFAWDGPSGPTFDTKSFMRGSLVHDALYQLICDKQIPDFYREYADRLLYKMCREDGMSSIRAWYVYKAVSAFGENYTNEGKPILEAP